MNILAISGSLQRTSSNTALLRAAEASVPAGVTMAISDGIRGLPHFDPDLDAAGAPPEIEEFRAEVAAADAVLFSTPEYAHALPGALKDALDWLVGSGELVDKPVAVMSASPGLDGGVIAGDALVALLGVLSARVVAQLAVGAVRAKRADDGSFRDTATLDEVAAVVHALVDAARN